MRQSPGQPPRQASGPRAARPAPRHSSITERIASAVTHLAGTAKAHWFAIVLVVTWIAIGPIGAGSQAGYEILEQTVNSLSFLMLFLLQRSQNKDTLALQLKLDELVASNPKASNRVLNAEGISEDDLERLHRHFETLDRLSREDPDLDLTEEDAYRRHAEEQRHAKNRSDGHPDDD